jgi:hypothetical protein
MRIAEIRVAYEKRLSDNNDGGECSRVELVGIPEGHEEPTACAQVLLAQARTRVHEDLQTSLIAAIRRQVEPPLGTPMPRGPMVTPTEYELEPTPFDDLVLEPTQP